MTPRTPRFKVYYVARYHYNTGERGIACSDNVDCLPPCCKAPVRAIFAPNRKVAIRDFRALEPRHAA